MKFKKNIKVLRGQYLRPGCDIKLVSWYQHSSTLKSCIAISWVSLNRITLERSESVSEITFVVFVIILSKKRIMNAMHVSLNFSNISK